MVKKLMVYRRQTDGNNHVVHRELERIGEIFYSTIHRNKKKKGKSVKIRHNRQNISDDRELI